MEKEKRKARFTEIVMSIDLLDVEQDDIPRLPNNTEGLADGALRQALIAHALREGEAFTGKLATVVMGSAVSSMNDRQERPSEDEICALGLSASLAWASGQLPFLLNVLGVAGKLCIMFDDLELPDDFSILFRPQGRVSDFGKIEPYDLLDEKVTPADILKLAHTDKEMDELKEAIAQMVAEKMLKGEDNE